MNMFSAVHQIGSTSLLLSIAVSLFAARDLPAAGPQVAMRTVYQTEAIGRARVITIEGELGGEGTVTLDPNTCTIDQFGDRGICTRIAPQPVPVKIVQMRIADPTGQGRRLFQLSGELQPEGASYFLVVPRRRSEAHRLVVNLSDDKRRAVTLEPTTQAAPKEKPELCKKAAYRAKQAGGKVTVVATGEHPTAGFQTEFEQLPIRIYPPQFRLVCQKPTGIVAQVITPFQVETGFKADNPVKSVVVYDANGKHIVDVDQGGQ